MPRFHLRHDTGIDSFLDHLVAATRTPGAGAAPEAEVRVALREVLRKDMMQADICGLFATCSDVGFRDPFAPPDA